MITSCESRNPPHRSGMQVFCFQDEKRDVFYLRLQSHATAATALSRQPSFARNAVDDVGGGGEIGSSRTSSFGSATGFRMAASAEDFVRGSIAKNVAARSATTCDYIGKKKGKKNVKVGGMIDESIFLSYRIKGARCDRAWAKPHQGTRRGSPIQVGRACGRHHLHHFTEELHEQAYC